MKNDYVSIIIPHYNTKKWCKPLMDKLVFQKENYYPETEIILIDDCSTEDTSWINEYKNKIKIVKNKTNKGVACCRNIGLKKTTGEYIQFVDSDDDITDDFLHIIYTNIRKGYDYLLYRWIVGGKVTQGDIPDESIKWNWALWGYTFTRKCIGNEKFNEKMNYDDDYDFINRVLSKPLTRFIVDTPIYIYNMENENSLSHLITRGELERIRK